MALDVVRFRFETSGGGGYVPVLGDSALVDGPVATQTAGSSNPGIYYQVGGGGLNGLFARELGRAGQLDEVNARLRERYDTRFGPGAWAAANGEPPDPPPLTSWLVPVVPGVPPVGERVGALVYSVGPVLGPDGITDEAAYRSIYRDAFREIDRANQDGSEIDAFRITMLSTGIYAAAVRDPSQLFAGAARLIISGITDAVVERPVLADVTVLINSQGSAADSKEQQAFDRASNELGCRTQADGFDVVIPP